MPMVVILVVIIMVILVVIMVVIMMVIMMVIMVAIMVAIMMVIMMVVMLVIMMVIMLVIIMMMMALLIDEGYGYMSLLSVLSLNTEARHDGATQLLKAIEENESGMHQFFAHMVGSVELVFLGEVQKVFFPMPTQVIEMLADWRWRTEAEVAFQQVTRRSPQEKVKAFIFVAQLTVFDIDHMYTLRQSPRMAWLSNWKTFLKEGPFWVSLLICSILVVKYKEHDADPYESTGSVSILRVVTVVHVAAAILSCWKFVKVDAPSEMFRLRLEQAARRRSNEKDNKDKGLSKGQRGGHEAEADEIELWRMSQANKKFSTLEELSFLRYYMQMYVVLASMVMSLFGALLSPFFFVFHLLLYFERPAPTSVVLAIYQVREKIASTICLGVIIMAVFAFVSYKFFYEDIELSYRDAGCIFAADETSPTGCAPDPVTLFQTLSVHVANAFLNRDIMELTDKRAASGSPSQWRLTPPDADSDFYEQLRNFHAVIFSLLWQLIMVNIITGLVLDAFLTIRLEEKERVTDTHTRCFICSHDRVEMDEPRRGRRSSSFNEHIEKAHNPWSYIAYLVYLKHKSSEDYNGLESFVNRQMLEGHIDFMPVLRSRELELEHMRIEEAEEEEELAAISVAAELKGGDNHELAERVDSMLIQLNERGVAMEAEVAELRSRMEEQRRAATKEAEAVRQQLDQLEVWVRPQPSEAQLSVMEKAL
eukprot:gene5730-6919_t